MRFYDGPAHDQDYGKDIALDSSANVVVLCQVWGGETGWDFATVKYDSAGELLWAARYDGPDHEGDIPSALALDRVGNIHVAGPGGFTATERDLVTIKYSPDGEQLWVARHDGPVNYWDEAEDVAVDDSGYVYVTGWEAVTRPGPLSRYVTIKYDSDGVEQWVATHRGLTGRGEDEAKAVGVDGAGNVFVTGSCSDTGNFQDMVTVKYDRDGRECWVANYHPVRRGGVGRALAPDGRGGVYVAGSSGGNTSALTTVAYDSAGNVRWDARYVGPHGYGGHLYAIAVHPAGYVHSAGTVKGARSNSHDYATLKYDSAGSEHWARVWSGEGERQDGIHAIAVDTAGNVYVTGASRTGPGVYEMECVTVKYDRHGQELWDAHFTTGYYDGGYGRAVAVDGLGCVYVAGSMAVDSLRSYDAFVAKYVEHPGGLAAERPAAIARRLPPTIVRSVLPLGPTETAVLLDISGRKVMDLQPGLNDISRLSPGVYFLRSADSGGRSAVQKVIVQR